MYESVIWVSLGSIFFALCIYCFRREKILMVVACALTAFGILAGDAAPAVMDPNIHPLVPVLRSNYWLTIHVLTITLSYSALALCLGLGNVALFCFLRTASAQTPALALKANQLSYRAMQIGIVLLTAGTILGGVWADYSWGRFWGWDPKEVWALIALLVYLAIVHAKYVGVVREFAFSALSVLGFLSVVMAWYGVNFVLGAGLHSYGFSTGGRAWVFSAAAIQIFYVMAVVVSRKLFGTSRGFKAITG
jgi:ABC-type transport system involved in cytochrome c biogenesis permease subunit